METLVTDFTAPTNSNTEAVALSTTAAQSAAFAADVSTVMFISDAATFIKAGTDPTAVNTGTDMMVPANTLLRIRVVPGHKLSMILGSGTGTARITPIV